MNKAVAALAGLSMFFVASAFGSDQRPPQQQAEAASDCVRSTSSAAAERTSEGRDCDDHDEPAGPAVERRLHKEKIVHRDLAARSSVPTVVPSANPQPGVAPLGRAKSAGCAKGKATVKGHADQDCDSDDDGVAAPAE